MTEPLQLARRSGAHDRFFAALRRFAYARRVIDRRLVHLAMDLALADLVWQGSEYSDRYLEITPPVHQRLARIVREGEEAIERADMDAMFRAEDAAAAELRRILDNMRPRERHRHYWRLLTYSGRLTYEERVAAMMKEFNIGRRQVERNVADLPDKIRR